MDTEVVILGAGAAGLMCAIEAGKRGRKVLILDHNNRVGKKILMSGGGYCNFTNQKTTAAHYLSHNPHFCKSALSRYTPQDFITLVEKYQIPFHEKTLGQLFCDRKSKDIVDLLLAECALAKVDIQLSTDILHIEHQAGSTPFKIKTSKGHYHCASLVVATGGLSIPTMGATPLGYHLAQQFNIPVWPTRAGLVPLTLHEADKERFSSLSGIAVNSLVHCKKTQFRENSLFTHRGLSGPAILQISSYWSAGEPLYIDLLPAHTLLELSLSFLEQQKASPELRLKTLLAAYLPKRVLATFLDERLLSQPLKALSPQSFEKICSTFKSWIIQPNNTEGYRTAEVTLGGVDCNALSSKTMESHQVPGLYFIGEVVDVSGWLGGYNFQWAWSSGWAAGQVV